MTKVQESPMERYKRFNAMSFGELASAADLFDPKAYDACSAGDERSPAQDRLALLAILNASEPAAVPVEFSVQINATREDGGESSTTGSAFRLTVNQQLLYQLHVLQTLCKNHGLSEVRKLREVPSPAPSRVGLGPSTQEFVVDGSLFQIRYQQVESGKLFVTDAHSIQALDDAYDERQVSGDTSVLTLRDAAPIPIERDRPRG